MNIFEQASKLKLRFQSNRGDLSTEDLWDLPLTSKQGFDLDTVAKAVNSTLKTVTEESFVKVTNNPAQAICELRLEIVKHVIAVKLAANEESRLKAAKAAEREKLLGALADHQDAALKALTPEQIQARLKELDS